MKCLPIWTAVFTLAVSSTGAAQDGPRVGGERMTEAQVREAYDALPLRFERNIGQTDASVQFIARGRSGSTLFLTATDAVLALRRPASSHGQSVIPSKLPPVRAAGVASQYVGVRMRLLGARDGVTLEGVDALPGRVNYLVGSDRNQWQQDVATYGRVRYQGVYPGIDLLFYSSDGELEYDFVVAPGASPDSIDLAFEGIDLTLNATGDLVGQVEGGELRLRKPVLYQQAESGRIAIDGRWILRDARRAAFDVGPYDATRPLVIDPVLSYSTYLGRSGLEVISDLAVDPLGNAYLVGETDSGNFPTTAGAFQGTLAGVNDVFVAKLAPDGTLVYSTYVGGSGSEVGTAIAVDPSGHAHIVGVTQSADFPTTAGALQMNFFGGTSDAFAAKLDASGSSLLYATFLGGSDTDAGEGLAIDPTGHAYVAGSTLSADFPATPGAFQPGPSSGLPAPPTFTPSRYDAFVAKLSPTGSALVYATYFGGTREESGISIAVDATGHAYLTGATRSDNLPTTDGAFQRTGGGLSESAFVTKLNSSGSALAYSTYLDGSHHEFGSGIVVDAAGHAYVTGGTQSADFPTTPGAYRATHVGDADAFVTKLDPTAASLVYSTYLGGSGQDWGDDIAIDALGTVHVIGSTRSTNFPVTPGAIQSTPGGGLFDSFVAKLAPTGSALIYSTYLGGNNADFGSGIAVAGAGAAAHVSGFTSSPDFPVTPGALQGTFGGHRDGFAAKITDGATSTPSAVGRVSGGGSVRVQNGLATFSVNLQRNSTARPITGHVQYVNHATQEKVRSVTITSLAIAGNVAMMEGTCVLNRTPCTFAAVAIDNGEPGKDDAFTITVGSAPSVGGVLRGGNVRVRRP